MLESYLEIVKKQLCDTVPKAITCVFVRKVEEKVKKRLPRSFTDTQIAELVAPSAADASRLASLENTVTKLQESMQKYESNFVALPVRSAQHVYTVWLPRRARMGIGAALGWLSSRRQQVASVAGAAA